jgi:hypothetical protein
MIGVGREEQVTILSGTLRPVAIPRSVGAGLILRQCLREPDKAEVFVVDLEPDGLRLFGDLVEGAQRVFECGTHDWGSTTSISAGSRVSG